MLQTHRLIVVGAAAIVLVLGAAPAVVSGQDSERARRTFQIAEAHYNNGEYEAAAQRFAEAYLLSGRKHLLYNIYLAFRDGQDPANARDALAAFVADPPEGTSVAQLRLRLERMEARHGPARRFDIRKLAAGSIETPESTPDESTAETPGGRSNPAGSEAAEDTAPRSGNEAPGVGDPDGDARPPMPPAGAITEAEPSSTSDVNLDEPPTKRPFSLVTGAAIAFVVGGAGVLGAVIFGATALQSHAAGEKGCALDHSCTAAVVNHVRSLALMADLSAGIAIAGAGLGVVLLILNGSRSETEATTTSVEPFVDLRGIAGMSLRGAF